MAVNAPSVPAICELSLLVISSFVVGYPPAAAALSAGCYEEEDWLLMAPGLFAYEEDIYII